MNSNINVWSKTDVDGGVKTPSYIIEGHSSIIYAMTNVNGVIVSGDSKGKVYSWNKEAVPQAHVVEGDSTHPNGINFLDNINGFLVSSSSDGTIKKSALIDGTNHAFKNVGTLKLASAIVGLAVGNGNFIYAL